MLCLTPFSLLRFSIYTFQGYVTVSEINELYSQFRGDPKHTPALANASLDSVANPSPGDDAPKPPEDEVCVVVQRACACC